MPLIDRFICKFVKTDTCWIWTGAKSKVTGYGAFSLPRPRSGQPAHRVAYELFVGPIPEGLVLDHICRNRLCVNPNHLEPVTQRENLRRSPLATCAINMRKTECIRGHRFTPENTYIDPKGYRVCRECQKIREHKFRLNNKRKRIANWQLSTLT